MNIILRLLANIAGFLIAVFGVAALLVGETSTGLVAIVIGFITIILSTKYIVIIDRPNSRWHQFLTMTEVIIYSGLAAIISGTLMSLVAELFTDDPFWLGAYLNVVVGVSFIVAFSLGSYLVGRKKVHKSNSR